MQFIGIRLKNIRKLLNKSQDDLAKALNITKQGVSNIETGKSLPGIAIVHKLCVEFDVNLNYLIAGQGETFTVKEKTYQSLRDALINEVETILNARGIE